jgi:hypothetical protein
MKIGVVKEAWPDECRVAASPKNVQRLIKQGFAVFVESGAGVNASFTDQAYVDAGATISDVKSAWADVDIVIKVRRSFKRRRDSHQFHLAWPGKGTGREVVCTQGYCACHGLHSTNQSGPKNGCLVFDGKYRWIPSGTRSSE